MTLQIIILHAPNLQNSTYFVKPKYTKIGRQNVVLTAYLIFHNRTDFEVDHCGQSWENTRSKLWCVNQKLCIN